MLRRLLLFGLIALLLPGCANRPREAPDCDDSENFACFRGGMRGLLGAAVEDVEICPLDLDDVDCVRTAADGSWSMPGLPRDADLALTAEHPDFTATLFPQNSAMDWYAWFKVMVPPSIIDTHANRLDVELDPERGHILFLTWEGLNIDGVDTPRVPDVVGEVVEPAGAAMFYGDALGLASASAEATTASGSGGVLDLEPGIARIRLTAPAGPCGEQNFHWAAEADNVIPVPVRAGFVTAIDVLCPVDE